MRGELRDALVAALGREAGAAIAAIGEAMETQITARWPPWLDAHDFARYVAARIELDGDPAAELAELYAIDLYLAAACARGIAAAIAALEREYIAALPAVVRTVDANADFVDEIVQRVREKLLVAEDGSARIETYSGHGPLGAFLRVTAIRIALSALRRKTRHGGDDELAVLVDGAAGADARLLATQLGAELRAALRAAVAAQPARMRAILRMYYVDGHGVEEIGRVYRVHASSISRWLARTRAAILTDTRAQLLARLAATESVVDSLLGHMASIDISLGSVLRSA